jgi:hypothetical protein
LERAIACYQEALKVYTLEAFPEEWAMTQKNLGDAMLRRFDLSNQTEIGD